MPVIEQQNIRFETVKLLVKKKILNSFKQINFISWFERRVIDFKIAT